MTQETPDTVPQAGLAPQPQQKAEIAIVGDQAVKMLDDIVSNLKDVSTQKGAVLRMIGIFQEAIGKELLIKGSNEEPLSVQDLWQ